MGGGGAAGHSQRPYGFHVAGAGLGLSVGFTALGGPGCGHGVDGIRLAVTAAPLAVRATDLDHRHVLVVQVTGQPGPVGAGAFHPGRLDGPETGRPSQRLAVTGRVGRERLHAQLGPPLIEHADHVDIAVGVNPGRDPPGRICHCCHCHPFVGSEPHRGGPHRAGTADKTGRGLSDRLLLGHVRPTGAGRAGPRARSTNQTKGNQRQSLNRVRPSPRTYPTLSPTPTSNWWMSRQPNHPCRQSAALPSRRRGHDKPSPTISGWSEQAEHGRRHHVCPRAMLPYDRVDAGRIVKLTWAICLHS